MVYPILYVHPSIVSHDNWKEPKPSARAYLIFSLIISFVPETQTCEKSCRVCNIAETTIYKWNNLFSWYHRGVRRKLDEVPASADAWQFTVNIAITLLLNTIHVQVSFIRILGSCAISVDSKDLSCFMSEGNIKCVA